VEQFLQDWGYLGIFLGIVATGMGFPMPEELPVVVGGVLSGHQADQGSWQVHWYFMLPVCIVAVIIGDSILYFIGRFWGPRLLESRWVKKHALTPERLTSIERNFHDYGVRILLFARMTPGVRAPIFLTAGIIRLPVTRFVFADSLYAVPGVSLLFFLGYYFGDGIISLVERAEHVKFWIMLVLVVAVGLYILYRFLRKPAVTGDPKEMPPLVGPVTNKIEQKIEQVAARTLQKIKRCPPGVPPPCPGQEIAEEAEVPASEAAQAGDGRAQSG
jgi:membrane protein DedA with SNARE-associated domain